VGKNGLSSFATVPISEDHSIGVLPGQFKLSFKFELLSLRHPGLQMVYSKVNNIIRCIGTICLFTKPSGFEALCRTDLLLQTTIIALVMASHSAFNKTASAYRINPVAIRCPTGCPVTNLSYDAFLRFFINLLLGVVWT
jgi:hypothetical protein